ncbi:M50 family metallopeptidase [Nonomuraea sp. NPDC050404]|uniref:M50 family metallopeptidase n=1 Tax=Nonomuraea sp. NPDC050404 TaxID=3155783 RepID=UPI0033F4466D
MTTAPAVAPRLRPDVTVGPPLLQGPRVVHFVKDRRTGWYFSMGAKEVFVLSRLDGQHTFEDIEAAYAERFKRRLGPDHWTHLLALLTARRLLAGTDDEQAMRELATRARAESRGNNSLLRARLPLFDPDRLLSRIEPSLRWCFRPWVVIPSLIAVVALEAWLAFHLPVLYAEATRVWTNPAAAATVAVLGWAMLALHELAHGLTCKHYGGQVPEIGLLWRFPLLAPYCKADDAVLFHRSRHGVYTAFAGVFASLVVLLPFWALYGLPVGTQAREAVAGVLLFGSMSALVNLVPFLQLDGYYMLTHALGVVNLRAESARYLRRLARRLLPGGSGEAYPRRARLIYLTYGLVSATFGLCLATLLITMWFTTLSERFGPPAAAIILTGEAVVLLLAVRYFARRRKRSAEGTA